jgi:hypothetical protein
MACAAGLRRLLFGVAVAGLAAACGSQTQPEVQSATPLTAQTVTVRQTGNAQAQLLTSTITFQVDDSGSLVIHADVMSQSGSAQTITARASLYDSTGSIIGDATGGQIAVAPGATTSLQLNGPGPHGTIASAVVELTEVPAATPIVNTPIPAGT